MTEPTSFLACNKDPDDSDDDELIERKGADKERDKFTKMAFERKLKEEKWVRDNIQDINSKYRLEV